MAPANQGKTPPSTRPLVVKLGGSLFNHVPALVTVLRDSPRPLFIVPGGGAYADRVRDAGLPPDESHWKAIEAMDAVGAYIGICGIAVTADLAVPAKTRVFLPSRCLHERDPLPHSWDVTSDTIAAWVARELGLDLLILKSVDGILVDGSVAARISRPVTTDVLDPCCIPYILKHNVRTTIINGTRTEILAGFLQGKPVPCTRIGTTF